MSIFKRKNAVEEFFCETDQSENKPTEENKVLIKEFSEIKFNAEYLDETLKAKITSCIEDFRKEKIEEEFTKYSIDRALDAHLFDKLAICFKCEFYKCIQMLDNNFIYTDKYISIIVKSDSYCVGGISNYPIRCNEKIIECNSFKLKKESKNENG